MTLTGYIGPGVPESLTTGLKEHVDMVSWIDGRRQLRSKDPLPFASVNVVTSPESGTSLELEVAEVMYQASMDASEEMLLGFAVGVLHASRQLVDRIDNDSDDSDDYGAE